jgi:RHS repeat-associated protein
LVEKTNGVIQADKRFLWCGSQLCEERDSTGASVTKRFLGNGEQISGTNYYLTRDHLGSIRELTDTSGAIRARYDYDPYGRQSKTAGDMSADFGFTGHFQHPASGLSLAPYRAYVPNSARWLSRDPVGESGGLNLYAYCFSNPINETDPEGLFVVSLGFLFYDYYQYQKTPCGNVVGLAMIAVDVLAIIADLFTGVGGDAAAVAIHSGSVAIKTAKVAKAAFSGYDLGNFVVHAVNAAGGQGSSGDCSSAPNTTQPTWPNTAQEMNALLGVEGKAIPDKLHTPGRDKTVWELGPTKITLEQHPYDANAPDWHKNPHWHLDTPGNPHKRYLPGDPIPGF